MPLPTPNEGESENDFISRCMASETMNTDFPQQAQRSAVCFQRWRESKGFPLSSTQPLPIPAGMELVKQGGEWLLKGKPMSETGTNEIQVDNTDTTIISDAMPVWGDAPGNALKAISRTDDTITVANYLIVFGGRDLEGVRPMTTEIAWRNIDGSRGEYFTKSTDLESFYTRAGAVIVDWEHKRGELGDEDLGVVDWKTARIDDKGVFAERVLNRRNKYVQWLEELGWFDDGTLGTSSLAVPSLVQKAADGQITRWPLMRDTITVSPMEPRMITENHLQAFKALGIPVPDDSEPEPEHETSPEADTSAVDVAKARVRAQLTLIELMED